MVEGKQINVKEFETFKNQMDAWIKYLDRSLKHNKDVIKRFDDVEEENDCLYDDIVEINFKLRKLEDDIDFMKFMVMIIFEKVLPKQDKEQLLNRHELEKTVNNLDKMFGKK
jgi:hypothetical protein